MADRLTTAPRGIRLRPVQPGDREFLLQLYATTRADELSLVPWSDADKARFVEMQFEAQDASYRRTYPGGRFLVVCLDDTPIGRLYTAVLEDEIRIIDITLLPSKRGSGLGSRLLADVLAEADAAGLPVRLHVERSNPARRLYERFGFQTRETSPVYELMERTPLGSS